VARTVAETPQPDCKGQWVECSPQTVGHFSAVGYFFGRELHRQLNEPIGLIHSSWGGTPAEAWTSRPALEENPACEPILTRYKEALAQYPQAQAQYEEDMAKWKEAAAQAREAGTPPPRRPSAPLGPTSHWAPAGLYNGMIAPLVSYVVRGAIWYQGESNAGRAYQYRELFPTLIKSWRTAWDRTDFPFLFVQLANYMDRRPEPNESNWAELREAQLMTLDVPNTGMAVIVDIGDAKNIHPKNKQDVGKRLALWALAQTYGKNVVYSGPLYQSMEKKGDKIVLHFDHVGGGLVARGAPDDRALPGFALAGADRRFVWADARIEGETVVVSSPQIADPLAVRYAWADNPVCSLYNRAGLPASPFRTDTWPGITVNNK
jgi:sialate O-acetylesterase